MNNYELIKITAQGINYIGMFYHRIERRIYYASITFL